MEVIDYTVYCQTKTLENHFCGPSFLHFEVSRKILSVDFELKL